MTTRVLRRPATHAILLASAALAVSASPVAAVPDEFANEVRWTLECDGEGTIDVRSQSSNGVVWVTDDGRTLMTLTGEAWRDGAWAYVWGPPRLERTALAGTTFTCTTTITSSSGAPLDLRMAARYVP